MMSRIRLIITSILLCQLFVAVPLLTSQIQPGSTTETATKSGEPVTIKANQQEKDGPVYSLRGDVEITARNYVFRADEVTFNSDSGEITATGNIVFDGGPHDEHITATRATYNVNTEDGRFWNVVGTTGARFRGKTVVLTSSEPFAFTGRIVDKVGRDKIVVHYGTATTCRLPRPKWTFNAQRISVVAGKDAKIYHSTFRLFGVPVFYFPFADHPVERLGRKTGFLIPTIGRSSRKGNIVGDSFFWAINRSADLTLGAEYYSKRGWAQHFDFNARPSDKSFIYARYFGVIDRLDQGGQELRLNAEHNDLPYGFRGVADIDYLNSFVFRLAFAESYTQAINSEVKSNAFVVKDSHGFSFGSYVGRYQNFECSNVTSGEITADVRCNVITIVHVPTLHVSTVDRRVGNTPVFWSFDAASEGLSRREPNFVTANVVGRFDLSPAVTVPLQWRGLSVRATANARNTYYTDRLIPGEGIGTPVGEGVNRQAVIGEVEIRPPALQRTFEKPILDHNVKHVFEPRVTYRNVSGVDNFASIIRFDERDILSDTNEVEYGFVNRLYSKRVPKDTKTCTGNREELTEDQRRKCDESRSREFISWELAQKYFIDPNFGGALVAGKRNVFTTTAEFTGIAFLSEPRRFSPIISRLRARSAGNTEFEWHLDYDPRESQISSSMAFVNYHFMRDFYVGAGHAFLRAPGNFVSTDTLNPAVTSPSEFNQFRILAQYGSPTRRGMNVAGTIGYDANLGFLQYAAGQMTYNWDCCGISFEYRRFALGAVRNENQYRFAITLANVGTFGTLRKQERLF